MKIRKAYAIVILFCILVVTACNWGGKDKPDVIKIGYLAHPGYLPLFCADDQNYFNEVGVKVELVRFESSPAMVSAFSSGDIQVAPMATASALGLESLDNGKFKVFALSSETVDHYLTAVVVKNQEEYNSITDLKGKKIGIFPGPAARALFELTFESYGLIEGEDVFFQELGPPLHIQALMSGQVDALATYEPIATQAVIEHGAYKILPAAVETRVLSPTQGGSWIISNQLVENYPDLSFECIKAVNKGFDYINSNPEQLPQLISKYANVSLPVAQKAPIVTYSKLNEIDLSSYQKHADLMYEKGVISTQIDVSGLLLNKSILEGVSN